MSVSKKSSRKVTSTTVTTNPQSNADLATKAKAFLGQAVTLLAPGEPLSAKDRREVVIRTIRTTPALVTAAAATYTEHASVLGGDLDAAAALDAQDYVLQLTPVVTEIRTLAQALEDRIHEHEADAATFAQTVHDRAQAMQRMPQGSALGARIAQLEELSVRPKRKAKKKDEEAPVDATDASPEAASTAAPQAAQPTVVVNAAKP